MLLECQCYVPTPRSSNQHSSQISPAPLWVPVAGMQHILQEGSARVMVLKFGRRSSDLLAYGAMDGVVRIADIGQTSTVKHVGHMSAAQHVVKTTSLCMAWFMRITAWPVNTSVLSEVVMCAAYQDM